MARGDPSRLSDELVGQIRARVLTLLAPLHPTPERLGLLLIGSLAQGLGNTLSDVDVVAIDFRSGDHRPPSRTYGYLDGRRCDVWLVTVADLADLTRRADADFSAYDAWGISGLYFRIAFGLPIQNAEETAATTAAFSRQRTSATLTAVHAEGAVGAIERALVMDQLGLWQEAAAAFRNAVGHHLKLVVARTGCYAVTGSKYLAVQLARSAAPAEYAALLDLWRIRLPDDPKRYIRNCAAELTRHGVRVERDALSTAHLVKEVERLRLVDAPALRHDDRLFLVDPNLEPDLGVLLERRSWQLSGDASIRHLRLTRALFQYGLVRIEREGKSFNAASPRKSDPVALPSFAADGPRWPAGACRALVPVDVSSDQMLRLACRIFEQTIIYANSKEDVVGAIRERAWSQVEVKLRDMMTAIAIIALANRAILVPDTSSAADAHLHASLVRDPDLAAIGALFWDLMRLGVEDSRAARGAIDLVEGAAALLPAYLLAEGGRCMESGEIYRRFVLELGGRLVKLARQANLRDAITFDGGDAEDAAPGADALCWFRVDDMRAELARL